MPGSAGLVIALGKFMSLAGKHAWFISRGDETDGVKLALITLYDSVRNYLILLMIPAQQVYLFACRIYFL
jgi:hypothetical protein